jgi:hypothetical protein
LGKFRRRAAGIHPFGSSKISTKQIEVTSRGDFTLRRSQHIPATFLALAIFLGYAGTVAAQERRAYEGVVSWKQSTIGTVIMIEINDGEVSGWLRLEKPVAIDSGAVVENGVEFQSAGNSYRIDERRGRIVYSGPQGEGNRYIDRLTRLTGRLEELLEETESSPRVATVEVRGRRRDLHYGTPALWKNNAAPFEKFERLEDLLGKQVSVWVADADLRSGRIVVIEEPEGMDIPLKAPKVDKPKDDN